MTTKLGAIFLCGCGAPAGLHGTRCSCCQSQQCEGCTRASYDRLGMCSACCTVYERDMASIEAYEAREDALRVNYPEPRW